MTTRAQYMARAYAYATQGAHRFNSGYLTRYLTRFLDGVPMIEDTSTILFQIIGADMAVTTDQLFVKRTGLRDFTNFVITDVIFVRKTGAYNTACLYGVYSAAAAAGNAWVATGASAAALTGAAKIIKSTLAAIAGTEYAVNAPYLKLGTANGAALTADVFVRGIIVD